eukprot:1451082-Pyramimonas_sp.AAC.1
MSSPQGPCELLGNEISDEEFDQWDLPSPSAASAAEQLNPVQYYEDLKDQAIELFAATDPDTHEEMREAAARQAV